MSTKNSQGGTEECCLCGKKIDITEMYINQSVYKRNSGLVSKYFCIKCMKEGEIVVKDLVTIKIMMKTVGRLGGWEKFLTRLLEKVDSLYNINITSNAPLFDAISKLKEKWEKEGKNKDE